MKNKSITELTGLILKQNEMITRKNDFLRHASEEFRNIGKLATMCKGMKFTTAEATPSTLRVVSSIRLAQLTQSTSIL